MSFSSSQSAPESVDRSAASVPSLYKFFAPGGLLSHAHPNYEFRRGQLQMAEAVENALQEKRHLIVEAGTGTGKTLAYLVPAIRHGRRVIISTGTKNLQEQLFYKDIPFLEQHLGPLRVCYMKGRNNYLCRQKLYTLTEQPILTGIEEIDQYQAIAEWEKTTITGDRAEISTLPEASQLWHKLDARSDACIGQKCPQYDRCFITEMRRRALESDIVIVNHHLFFADLAIKQTADGAPDAGVLPEAAAVVFDEAHELEDVASNYFGITVSNIRLQDLPRDIEFTFQQKQILSNHVMNACKTLRERTQLFFAALPAGEGRFRFAQRQEFLEEHGDEYLGLQSALTRLASDIENMQAKPEEAYGFLRRLGELGAQLKMILESQERNIVFWIERRGGSGLRGQKNVFLQATPIDVSGILKQVLFEPMETVVLTSATLAVSGGFDYLRRRLGLEHARELVLPSHYDYQKQAVWYVPPDLPDPAASEFAARATQKIRRILQITRGRAFCLFTSYNQMNEIYERLLAEIDYPLLLQGIAPKSVLLDEFRMTPNAVLFATSSFWHGVDVQGEQLSCVIIDRLPFAVPTDPIVSARIAALNEDGGNAFFEYQVPSAVITLKQGFGRLIRSLDDRGLLVLLDNRILSKRYGKTFVESMPNYYRTTDLTVVEDFFKKDEGQKKK